MGKACSQLRILRIAILFGEIASGPDTSDSPTRALSKRDTLLRWSHGPGGTQPPTHLLETGVSELSSGQPAPILTLPDRSPLSTSAHSQEGSSVVETASTWGATNLGHGSLLMANAEIRTLSPDLASHRICSLTQTHLSRRLWSKVLPNPGRQQRPPSRLSTLLSPLYANIRESVQRHRASTDSLWRRELSADGA